jgi:hypothetical protein
VTFPWRHIRSSIIQTTICRHNDCYESLTYSWANLSLSESLQKNICATLLFSENLDQCTQKGCFVTTKSNSEEIVKGITSGLVNIGPSNCARTNHASDEHPIASMINIAELADFEGLPTGSEALEEIIRHQNAYDVLIDNFDFDKWASLAPIAALARRKAVHRDCQRVSPSHGVRKKASREPQCSSREFTPDIAGQRVPHNTESPQHTFRTRAGLPGDHLGPRQTKRRSTSADLMPSKVC